MIRDTADPHYLLTCFYQGCFHSLYILYDGLCAIRHLSDPLQEHLLHFFEWVQGWRGKKAKNHWHGQLVIRAPDKYPCCRSVHERDTSQVTDLPCSPVFWVSLGQKHTSSHVHMTVKCSGYKSVVFTSPLCLYRPCECNPSGTVDLCSPLDGRCHCKPNVEGQSCDRWVTSLSLWSRTACTYVTCGYLGNCEIPALKGMINDWLCSQHWVFDNTWCFDF